MRAVGVFPGSKEIRLVDQKPPQITAERQVRIRSLEVGVCGTDKEISSFVYGSPPPGSEYLILGHESLGEVIEAGTAVTRLKAGDLVVPSVRRPCSHEQCQPCRMGRPDFCRTGDFTERGIKMRHGYMTESYVEMEDYLTPVPVGLRRVGVLVEPLTVTEKALVQVQEIQKRLPWIRSGNLATPGAGLNAVVLGAGPVGLLAAMALLTRGYRTWVYSRSPRPNPKADWVEALGAVYVSSQEETVQQLAERVGQIDLVYEAVGVGEVAFQVLDVLGVNGIFVFTGIPAPKDPKPFPVDRLARQLVLKNQVALGTVNADICDFQRAVDDLGQFQQRWPERVESMISSRQSIDAYRDLLLGESHGIKNVITFGS